VFPHDSPKQTSPEVIETAGHGADDYSDCFPLIEVRLRQKALRQAEDQAEEHKQGGGAPFYRLHFSSGAVWINQPLAYRASKTIPDILPFLPVFNGLNV
jgi:hypothetical protein